MTKTPEFYEAVRREILAMSASQFALVVFDQNPAVEHIQLNIKRDANEVDSLSLDVVHASGGIAIEGYTL